MAQKGLGKGLGALLSVFDDEDENEIVESIVKTPQKPVKINSTPSSDVTRVTSTPKQPSGITEIDISLIDNNINQPRKEFDIEKLNELADSIKANGIIQPIILSTMGTRYMIVAGERRWRAAKLAGVKIVPAVVRNFTPAQIAEIAIVENLQRQDLNEIELARGIKKLIDEFKLTQEQAATRLGKNRSAIAHTLRLLTLPAEIIQMVEQNKLSAGHARCLVTLDKSEALKLARLCAQNNLSVRELEKMIQSKNTSSLIPPKYKPHQSIELKEMAREMTSLFHTKVSIQGDTSKGKVVIDYFSQQDLVRIRKHILDINKLVSVDDEIKSRVNKTGRL